METLESSRVCRLCGKQSGISINIFDKNQNHVKMINTVLPIMVHEMDLLPKHMCHRCSYKLETFHKFYLDCLKIDADLKGQLSWMRKEESRERVGVPMVHIENVKIKEEPHDYNTYDDTNPIVDNVDNVDYMNSVTFPVDGIESKGITYATYTRCGCYCDKTGQSFDNRLSRCNGRLGDVTSTDDTVANGPHSTKTNFLENKIPQDRSNLLTYTSEYSNNYRQYSTNSRRFAAKENVQETNFIRNLRPRKTAVDYVQTGRRATGISLPKNRNKLESSEDIPQTNFGVTQIKVEKLDDIVGRILRPRKRTIAYMYPKRKYSRKSEKNRSLPIDDRPPSKAKVRNIASQLKLKSMSIEKLKVDIKEEPVSDVEDFFNIVSTTPFDRMLKKNDSIGNLTDRTNLLRDGRVEFNDRTIGNSVHINRNQRDNNFGRNEIWDRAHSLSKSSSKSMETGLHRFIAANRSLGYLRSPDLCLRNGKIRRYNVPSASLKTIGRDLTERTRATIDVKNLSSSPMLFDDIKYYCDECNTKFASKELYKLHACYGHR